MNNEILPVNFSDLAESIYTGFWRRSAAILMDLAIISPGIFLLERRVKELESKNAKDQVGESILPRSDSENFSKKLLAKKENIG
jgi:hypothetical protein